MKSSKRLLLPRVYAIDEAISGNSLRQLHSPASQEEGEFQEIEIPDVAAHLFEPLDSSSPILVVPRKTKPIAPPSKFKRVLAADLDGAATKEIDLRHGKWLRHPKMLSPAAIKSSSPSANAANSWRNAFTFAAENEKAGEIGLRPPQLGAIHAVHAHWTVARTPATIVMPTGTGKSDTMLAILVSAECRRVFVVVPSDALRSQISEKFVSLGILGASDARILSRDALCPVVCLLRHIPKTKDEVRNLLELSNVMVTTSHIAAACSSEVQVEIARLCSHLFIDEAHHAEAPTWRAFKEQFTESKIVQFTATPFREDGRPLDGEIIFSYPLRKAQEEGYFKPIRFEKVLEFNPSRADEAIASKAVARFRIDRVKGHIVMARVDSVSRAERVASIYRKLAPDLEVVELHTGIKKTIDRERARQSVFKKRANVVVCVDMLGEGFDLPELKIAAFHDIRKTLAVTLQLAGRFTRSRPDLGDATFIANTADLAVQDELRRLYTQDPDWNVLLPMLSETAIGEQQLLQKFLKGFTSIVKEIPLRAVNPALSAVVYKSSLEEWVPERIREGIPAINLCEQVHVSVNPKDSVAIVVTARRVTPQWADLESVFNWEWDLYVVYWWAEKRLLFINGSNNSGDFKSVATAVAGSDAVLIRGQEVFRSFHGIHRLRLKSVGLSEQLGRNVSFTNRMGSDVAPVLARAQLGKARKSVLSGSGYESGDMTSVGASRKGRIWTHRRDNVFQLIEWCRSVGRKMIDPNIDPDTVLAGTLETKVLAQRPEILPISIDWPQEIYESVESPWSVAIDGKRFHLSEVNLELSSPSESGPLRFSISNEESDVVFELEIYAVQETYDFRFNKLGTEDVQILRSDTAADAAAFFTENAPRVWFADGSVLEGNEHTPLKQLADPFPREKVIDDWDWAGINIRKESQGPSRDKKSVQAAVISRLKRESYDLIFDDDGKGEVADVVAAAIEGGLTTPSSINVDLFHCKYSKRTQPGARVDDLYVVCGQAQTSIRWMVSSEKRSDLFTHLLRREKHALDNKKRSRIEVGNFSEIETLREISRTTPVNFRIFVVQPGVSKSRISDEQLRLLGVTENYLLETHQVPFGVVVSP